MHLNLRCKMCTYVSMQLSGVVVCVHACVCTGVCVCIWDGDGAQKKLCTSAHYSYVMLLDELIIFWWSKVTVTSNSCKPEVILVTLVSSRLKNDNTFL